MENKKSARELLDNRHENNELKEYNEFKEYNANRFLLKSIPKMQHPMGHGKKAVKDWLTLHKWRRLLEKIIKFEEVYIYKKEKKYYYLTG